jgi:osmotically-inducible protein OsmY
MNKKKPSSFLFFLIPSCLMLSSCVAPLIIGSGATVGAMATKEKGISGAMSDSALSTKVKAKIYDFHPDAYSQIAINVQEGQVLLTGLVKDENWRMKAQEITWKVEGVKQVYNYIEVNKEKSSWSSVLGDGNITTKIKSILTFTEGVRSLNYSIQTNNYVVYIMGIAQTKEEREKVVKVAQDVKGVKKVICFVKTLEEFKKN